MQAPAVTPAKWNAPKMWAELTKVGTLRSSHILKHWLKCGRDLSAPTVYSAMSTVCKIGIELDRIYRTHRIGSRRNPVNPVSHHRSKAADDFLQPAGDLA